MGRYRLTRRAELDLTIILRHIAKDNPRAGLKLVAKLKEKCRLLGNNAELGRARPDLGDRVRTFPVGNYVIIYQPREEGIVVARIVSGFRDLGALFG